MSIAVGIDGQKVWEEGKSNIVEITSLIINK